MPSVTAFRRRRYIDCRVNRSLTAYGRV
ncbi:rCG58556 [Rattus norvegicus]|uniref:RCG58556 n=1 Tax=Rattus norvegicus TaxID=10116 RepID=A6K6W1_RAT|nr:rCG58556 [Rattus norvegicus]